MSQTPLHTDPADPAIIGSVLGSYRILREISSGSMGTIFRAEHVLLQRPAAVKLLRAGLTTDADLVQRFVNEAKAVTACKHPGIVEAYDFGYTPDGHAFMVMEFLEGESLGDRLRRGRLTEIEAAAIASGIASALKAAHKVGVIHRDLKPDNVFLVPDPDGGLARTKVLDFGIAKLTDASSISARRTETGILIGTPLYMAPEQARAAGMIDPRADLYSLGCILYHMLVGRPPFLAEGAGEIIAMQLFGQVEPPSRQAAVTPQMEWLVLRLLEKDPADRFDSAAEVVTALAAFDSLLANRPAWPATQVGFSDHAPTLPPDTGALQIDGGPRPTAVPHKRSAISILAGVLAVLAIVGGGLVYVLQGDGEEPTTPGPAAEPLPVAAPAGQPSPAAPGSPAGQPTSTAPVAAPPTTPTAAPDQEPTPRSPRSPEEPASHASRVAPRGHAAAKPTSSKGDASAGSGSKAPATLSGDASIPDRAIEVIREIRPVEPAASGEHTLEGSPMETNVEFGKKRPKPAAPGESKNVLPSPGPPSGSASP
jgi:eukaryotic-like serine/threonine-protein kinase